MVKIVYGIQEIRLHITTMNILFILKVISLVFITIVKCVENQESRDTEIVPIEESVNKTVTKEVKDKKITRKSFSFWPPMEKDKDVLLLEQVLEDIEKGRGKNQRQRKKLTKFLYPLFLGVLVAKIILIPLILKMLTAISSSALVMSKIALITTGFIALKWIFSENTYDTKDRFEFIYLPNGGKTYRSASGGFSHNDDQYWSDSSNQYTAIAPSSSSSSSLSQQQKYIPVNLKHEMPYKTYRVIGSNMGNDVSAGVIANKNGLVNSVKDLYYYAKHNYNNNNNNEGKPFL